MRPVVAVLAVFALAGCGGDGGPPQPPVPAELASLDGAVMTGTRIVGPTELEPARLAACGFSPTVKNPAAVERTSADGESLTLRSGSSVTACDAIADPLRDPDEPYGGIWCGSAVGRLEDRQLNDPRLDLCTAKNGDVTAFAWVEPVVGTRWVVVREGDRREVYEVAGGLPVRVTTVRGVNVASSSATFEVEEYGADGTKLRAYRLNATVAG